MSDLRRKRFKSDARRADEMRATPSDKGKPAATQGRKARGPTGVAQLPNGRGSA